MQYDLDIRSEQAELFLHIRNIVLSFEGINELKNPKQTSYRDSLSTVCMLRVRKGTVRLSFANGARMNKRYPELRGEAKIVRYIEFTSTKVVDEKLLRAMIKESLFLNIEKEAIKELRKTSL